LFPGAVISQAGHSQDQFAGFQQIRRTVAMRAVTTTLLWRRCSWKRAAPGWKLAPSCRALSVKDKQFSFNLFSGGVINLFRAQRGTVNGCVVRRPDG
jgi:hypothetical protein